MSEDKPTRDQAEAYQCMFDFFNDRLFEGKLPKTMLIMSRNANLIGGYFSPERWFDENKEAIGEIAINANVLKKEGIVKAMGILIHEMLHLWQYAHGEPSRQGYHNTEWAQKAKEIGLQPFGRNGEEVGQAIDTKLIEGGKAEQAIIDFPADELFPWMSEPLDSPEGGGGGAGGGGGSEGMPPDIPRPHKPGTRSKYTCPVCGINVWGKSNLSIICAESSQLMIENK